MSEIRKISADWIFPLTSPPIKNGVLIFDQRGEILDLIDPEVASSIPDNIEKSDGILCPGFVNTHCHLELSWMKGKIPEQTGLAEFVLKLQKAKQEASQNEIMQAIALADMEMCKNGIVAVGDVSNTDYSFEFKSGSNIYYHTFIEVYASMPEKAKEKFTATKSIFDLLTTEFNMPASITPHATYSVSPPLFDLIKQHAKKHNSALALHQQETLDENLLFLNKTGGIVENMKKLGINYSWFEPTGKSPLESIRQFLLRTNPFLLVHNTFSTEADINFALSEFKNLFWCLCPNANRYIEYKLPDISLFAREKLKLTVGTDSLASNYHLSVLEEMKTIAQTFPEIPLHELFKWSSLNGAEFLGIEKVYGSFEKGKIPGINQITDISKALPKFTPNSQVIPIK